MVRLNFITGGAGFIGSHLALALLKRGKDVLLLDRPEAFNQPDATLRFLRQRCGIWSHDLTQPLPPAFKRLPIERAFLLAGLLGVRQVLATPEQALLTNQLVTWHALEGTRGTGCRQFCFASTSELYDAAVRLGLAEFPVAESTPLAIDPAMPSRSSYALGKIASEFMVCLAARAVNGTAILARFHNVYGPRMGRKHVISEFIERSLAHRSPFPVYGRQIRHFCYVEDAIRAILLLTDLPEPPQTLAVNIGNDHEATDTESLARMITRLAGYNPPLEINDAPESSPPLRKPSLERLRNLTGYVPATPLAEGLERTFAWYAESDRRTEMHL